MKITTIFKKTAIFVTAMLLVFLIIGGSIIPMASAADEETAPTFRITETGTDHNEKLAAMNVSQSGNITMLFYFTELDEFSDSDYIEITVPMADEDQTRTYKEYYNDENIVNGRYVIKVPVAAAQQTDLVGLQWYKDGVAGKLREYSVKYYADKVLEYAKAGNATYMPMANNVKSMLNYGAMAQTMFNYNEGNLANDGLFTESNPIDNMLAEHMYDATLGTATDSDAITFKAINVYLRDIVNMRVYVDCPEGAIATVNGTDVSVNKDDVGTYVGIRNIPAHKFATNYDITVSCNGETATASYSVLSYCLNVINSDNVSSEMKDTAKALYLYYAWARNYVTVKDEAADDYLPGAEDCIHERSYVYNDAAFCSDCGADVGTKLGLKADPVKLEAGVATDVTFTLNIAGKIYLKSLSVALGCYDENGDEITDALTFVSGSATYGDVQGDTGLNIVVGSGTALTEACTLATVTYTVTAPEAGSYKIRPVVQAATDGEGNDIVANIVPAMTVLEVKASEGEIETTEIETTDTEIETETETEIPEKGILFEITEQKTFTSTTNWLFSNNTTNETGRYMLIKYTLPSGVDLAGVKIRTATTAGVSGITWGSANFDISVGKYLIADGEEHIAVIDLSAALDNAEIDSCFIPEDGKYIAQGVLWAFSKAPSMTVYYAAFADHVSNFADYLSEEDKALCSHTIGDKADYKEGFGYNYVNCQICGAETADLVLYEGTGINSPVKNWQQAAQDRIETGRYMLIKYKVVGGDTSNASVTVVTANNWSAYGSECGWATTGTVADIPMGNILVNDGEYHIAVIDMSCGGTNTYFTTNDNGEYVFYNAFWHNVGSGLTVEYAAFADHLEVFDEYLTSKGDLEKCGHTIVKGTTCSVCSGKVACLHTETTIGYKDGRYNVETCNNCGEVITEGTVVLHEITEQKTFTSTTNWQFSGNTTNETGRYMLIKYTLPSGVDLAGVKIRTATTAGVSGITWGSANFDISVGKYLVADGKEHIAVIDLSTALDNAEVDSCFVPEDGKYIAQGVLWAFSKAPSMTVYYAAFADHVSNFAD